MNATQKLSKLKQAATAERYPNVPINALPRKKYKSDANGLTRAIVDWLTLNGHFASRTSSAGRYLPKERRFIPSTTRKGYPDITATINGKSVYIEVKTGKDRMSESQQKVKSEIEASGGIYFIAHSFNDFMGWYNQLLK
jgi:Holliday junction resolvase